MVSKAAYREVFRLQSLINWYTGSHCQGLRQLQQNIQNVDCIVEMHDARIPISGRNIQFHEAAIGGTIPHLLLLNKRDLTDTCDHTSIARTVEQKKLLDYIIFASCTTSHRCANETLLPYLQDLAHQKQPRNGKKKFTIMICGIPKVGKRSLIKLFSRTLLAQNESTRRHIKICNDPDIFLLREPGELHTRILNTEMGLRVALAGCLPKNKVSFGILADYLLYFCNKHNHLHYVHRVGVGDQTDDILKVLTTLGKRESIFLNTTTTTKDGSRNKIVDYEKTSRRFVELFRTGQFGALNLDLPRR